MYFLLPYNRCLINPSKSLNPIFTVNFDACFDAYLYANSNNFTGINSRKPHVTYHEVFNKIAQNLSKMLLIIPLGKQPPSSNDHHWCTSVHKSRQIFTILFTLWSIRTSCGTESSGTQHISAKQYWSVICGIVLT